MKRLTPIIVLFLLSVSQGSFASVGGIELPKTQGDLKLHGAGLLRKGLGFMVYEGALCIESAIHLQDILGPVPKRIDIHYFHTTPKKHMIRVANQSLKRNLSPRQYNELLPKISKLHEAYLDGKKGSFASLIYRPGEGLTYSFDNETVASIPCDEFANAYFRVWLGDHPGSRSVKKAMRQDAREPQE